MSRNLPKWAPGVRGQFVDASCGLIIVPVISCHSCPVCWECISYVICYRYLSCFPQGFRYPGPVATTGDGVNSLIRRQKPPEVSRHHGPIEAGIRPRASSCNQRPSANSVTAPAMDKSRSQMLLQQSKGTKRHLVSAGLHPKVSWTVGMTLNCSAAVD